MLTGQFSVGSVISKLTIPSSLTEDDYLTLFVEMPVSANDAQPVDGLFIESDGEKAPFRNGPVLRTVRKRGKRVSFSVVTHEGEGLCTWQPQIYVNPPHPSPASVDYVRLNAADRRLFRRLGQPIEWVTAGSGIKETESFRIDGLPMTVLAVTPFEIILRDPAPALGWRTIQAAGYETTYRFVDVRLQVHTVSAARSTLDVLVKGLENLKQTVNLLLINYSRDMVSLNCGESKGHDLMNRGNDRDEIKVIGIKRGEIRNGVFECRCPLSVTRQGDPSIDALLVEERPKR
jgi:hypothetical protein